MGYEGFIVAGGLVLAGAAVKGVFTLESYRRARWNSLLALAVLGAIAAASYLAAGPGKTGLNRFLGYAIEPACNAGQWLGRAVPEHASSLRLASPALAAVLGIWGLLRKRRAAFPFAFLLLGLVFALTGAYRLGRYDLTWGPALLALGAFYAFASARAQAVPAAEAPGKPEREGSPTGALLLALIVLGAFALRVYRLEDVSIRFDHYETDYAWQALRILDGSHSPNLWNSTIWRGLGHTNFSPVYSYCVALSFRLLGVSLASLKLVPSFYGTLSVLLTYGIFNLLFGRRIGLISSFLMAVSPLALNYSRIGLLLVSTQAVSLLIVYLLLKAVLKRNVASYLLLGLACAFAGYFYSPAKYPILLAGAVLAGFIVFHRGFLRRHLPGLVLAVLFVLLLEESLHIPVRELMAPKFAGYESVWHRTQQHQYIPQADYIRGLPLVWENFILLVRSFFIGRGFNYDPWPKGNLFFSPAVPALTVLGIGFALGKIRKVNYRLLLFFFAAFLIPNLLSRPPVMVRRMMVSWPFIFALAAIPVSQLLGRGREALGRGGAVLLALVAAAGLGAGAAFDLAVFYRNTDHAGRWEDERHFDDYLLSLAPETRLYIVPIDQLGKDTINFRLLGRNGKPARDYRYIRTDEIESSARDSARSGRPAAVIAAPGTWGTAALRRLAEETGGEAREPRDPRGRRIAYALVFPGKAGQTPETGETEVPLNPETP